MADHSDFEPRSSVVPPARLTLLLLGPPQVMVNGEVVMDQRSPKLLALLAYLAVEAHRPHPRGTLAALFWPDQPEKQAYQSLRQTLSRLRRAIGDREADPPHLLADPQTIQFNPESDFWLDVATFKRLLADTQRHRHRRLDACLTCLSQLAQACAYYRGDFLTDLYVPDSLAFDEWLLVEREGLRRQACTALHALASAHLARGQFERARQCVHRLLSLDPWNELAQRLLLRALALGEGRNAALQHYQAFRQALADELGVEPEDETLALAEQIGAGALADVYPRTLTSHFPTPATPFVGREAERKQINDSLAGPHQRLLTLCGTGGIGKTRLALEVAAEQAPLWQDGVWFAPLAEVPAAEGLVDALADALNLRTTDGPLEAAQLMELLRPKELLLILDGFEHLMPPLSPPEIGGGPPSIPPDFGGEGRGGRVAPGHASLGAGGQDDSHLPRPAGVTRRVGHLTGRAGRATRRARDCSGSADLQRSAALRAERPPGEPRLHPDAGEPAPRGAHLPPGRRAAPGHRAGGGLGAPVSLPPDRRRDRTQPGLSPQLWREHPRTTSQPAGDLRVLLQPALGNRTGPVPQAVRLSGRIHRRRRPAGHRVWSVPPGLPAGQIPAADLTVAAIGPAPHSEGICG